MNWRHWRYWICAALCLAAGGVSAATDYFVAPAGPGGGGTNWVTAFSNVQEAVTLATNAGDRVFLQWGVYSNAAQILISNAAGLTVYGGCVGNGTNDYSGTNSTLTKTGGVMRIVCGYASTVTVAGVTVSGGSLTNVAENGAGLWFTDCAVVLTNCVVAGNSNRPTVSGSWYGGGVSCLGGSFAAVGTMFSNNVAQGSGSAYGGAVGVSNGACRLEECEFLDNVAQGSGGNGNGYGGAVAGTGPSAVIASCRFDRNQSGTAGSYVSCAGALFLNWLTGTVANCVFGSNTVQGNTSASQMGGAVMVNRGAVTLATNYFTDNMCPVANSSRGAALALGSCQTADIDGCVFEMANQLAGAEYIFASAATNATFRNCFIQDNNYRGGIWFTNSPGAVLAHCVISRNEGYGVYLGSGPLAMSNCLAVGNIGDGVLFSGGTLAVRNCTLADNGDWGLEWAAGTGTVFNSIAWGNTAGGIASNANVWVDYSCLQAPAYGGGNNLTNDPRFAGVPGCYYLSSNGLPGQSVSSPCIDAGTNTAAAWGLGALTTCTSGTNDRDIVDLGYHYTNGSALVLTKTNVFVDAVNGNNTNSGISWLAAWRSLTYALSNVAADATIHVATGAYSAAATEEVFPLTVQMPGLTIAASNSAAALTVVDNAGAAGRRVLQAQGMRRLAVAGLTFQGGSFTGGMNRGAGLLFQSTEVVMTNCVVAGHSNLLSVGGVGYGGGVYCGGGSFAAYDTVFSNNIMQGNGVSVYGGGLSVADAACRIEGCVFRNNLAQGISPGAGSGYGGGVYGSGPTVFITNCLFATNVVGWSGLSTSFGGAMYLNFQTAVVAGCVFSTNLAVGNTIKQGGGIYGTGQAMTLSSNRFVDNCCQGGTSDRGAAAALVGYATVRVEACVMDMAARSPAVEHLALIGVSNAAVLDSVFRNNTASGGIFFTNAAGTVTVARCTFLNNAGWGLWASAGRLGMTNCLLARNASNGLWIAGLADLLNCTLANNAGWGIARPTSAALTVKNSIVWGNSYGGIGHNQNLILTFTDSQDEWAAGLGTGNFSVDPLFVDAGGGDFHEKGVEGSYHGGAWAPDARNSPCLDAGDPASGWSLETKPNGNRINAGAYGNTAEATRSLPKSGTVLRIY